MTPNVAVPLAAMSIVESPYMVGAKRAVRRGNVIYVSPAMNDLILHAAAGELERLLANIPLLDLTRFWQPMDLI